MENPSEILQWRGTAGRWTKTVHRGQLQKVFVATRAQLIDHGQGECRRAGMVLQAVPSLREGLFSLRWTSLNSVTAQWQTVPCFMLPCAYYGVIVENFHWGLLKKLSIGFFSPFSSNFRTCWCWENRVNYFCLFDKFLPQPFFRAVCYSRQRNRASS